MSARIQAVGDHVMDCMDSILAHFKPGAKITVVVRQPDFPDGSRDMVVTTDEIEPVIKALGIRALSQAQERRGKGE
jgi:hypothetical protein